MGSNRHTSDTSVWPDTAMTVLLDRSVSCAHGGSGILPVVSLHAGFRHIFFDFLAHVYDGCDVTGAHRALSGGLVLVCL